MDEKEKNKAVDETPAKILQDALEASLSQPQEHSLVLPLTIPDLSQLLEQKDLQIK